MTARATVPCDAATVAATAEGAHKKKLDELAAAERRLAAAQQRVRETPAARGIDRSLEAAERAVRRAKLAAEGTAERLDEARAAAEAAKLEGKRRELEELCTTATRENLFRKLEPVVAELAELERYELVDPPPAAMFRLASLPTMQLAQPLPDCYAVDDAADKAIVLRYAGDLARERQLRRQVRAAFEAQHAAVATAHRLASELGVPRPHQLAPVPETHANALVALGSAPSPMTRAWIGAWVQAFGVDVRTAPHVDAWDLGPAAQVPFLRACVTLGDPTAAALAAMPADARARYDAERERRRDAAAEFDLLRRTPLQTHPNVDAPDPRAEVVPSFFRRTPLSRRAVM